ncbi:hypothetical protein [Rhodobaculum claviforme]|uniref:Uncharacterized protein n=1 Tax=Rhodobaculum claviforme TaxID=1549854 RepID=A0A934TKW7_9RHOB|nr:hypothetical protein [Rhodobaculum claviforme]MBK5927102.1 hypothetical protein [Rhodobaculum claviforme]
MRWLAIILAAVLSFVVGAFAVGAATMGAATVGAATVGGAGQPAGQAPALPVIAAPPADAMTLLLETPRPPGQGAWPGAAALPGGPVHDSVAFLRLLPPEVHLSSGVPGHVGGAPRDSRLVMVASAPLMVLGVLFALRLTGAANAIRMARARRMWRRMKRSRRPSRRGRRSWTRSVTPAAVPHSPRRDPDMRAPDRSGRSGRADADGRSGGRRRKVRHVRVARVAG